MLQYIVTLDWDKQDAVPFGTFHKSPLLSSKEEAWQYVKRVKERAELAQVQLHNIYVWDCINRRKRCVWALKDPRLSGDPWPSEEW